MTTLTAQKPFRRLSWDLGEQNPCGYEKDEKTGRVDGEEFLVVPEGNDSSKIFNNSFRQVRASFLANAAVIHPGMMFSFSAVALPQLESPESHIPITPEQASWIASVASFATPAGCILGGLLMEKVGRKGALVALAVPCILGWTLLGLSGLLPIPPSWALNLMYLARVLKGIGTGIVAGASRVYTSEVTSPNLRGSLCALASLGVSVGVLTGYSLGAAFSWPVMALLAGLVPFAVGLLSFILLPETPTWLLQRGRPQDAWEALASVRDPCAPASVIDHELEILGGDIETGKLSKLKVLTTGSTLKPLLLVVFYFLAYQFSGISVLTFYNLEIVTKTGVEVNAYHAAVIFGVIRLIFTIIGCVITTYIDRRLQTLLSGTFSGLAMLALGSHGFISRDQNSQEISLWWKYFPLGCITSFYVTYSLGCLLIPWVLLGELYPAKVRGFLGGVTACFSHTFLFAAIKSFPFLMEKLEFHGTFWLYGTIILTGSVLLYILLPETRARTLLEIEQHFKPKRTNSFKMRQ